MRRHNTRAILVFLAAVFILCGGQGWCQGRATVFGTVMDSTGAAVPRAAILLTNSDTQQVQTTVSSGDGSYVLSSVTPGHYTLKVTAVGFQSSLTKDIVIQVDENRKISPQLFVGAVTTEVQVTESVAQVDTRSPTLTQVIDSDRVKDLPLNGRNPLDLQLLVPGAGGTTNLNGQQQNAFISFNGNRNNENNYTLDGVDNEDPFFNSASIVPNPDALDQFSIETSNYSSQEGRGSGAQVNALLKAGSNKLHGSLFEYIRNPIFDAKPYFSKVLPPYRRNQFGGSLGGPILRERLFYFFSFQRTQQNASPGSQTLFVPSAAELKGDFSELLTANSACGTKAVTVKDPATGKAAPGNKIPTSSLNQAALNFVSTFVPVANGACNSYTYTPTSSMEENQYIGRIDSTLGQKDTLYGHIVNVENQNASSTQVQNLPGFYPILTYTNWHVAINETHSFSPRLLNVATFGYLNIIRSQEPHIPKQVLWSDLGAGIVRANAALPIGYQLQVPTYFNVNSNYELQQFRHEYQYSDNLSWAVGDHSFSFGGDLRQGYTWQTQSFQNDPQLQFAASFTGTQLGDFLTGHMNQLKQQSPNQGRPHNVTPALYVQDDWKATSRLTLNLGVRWEPFVPMKDELGRLAQFRPGQQSTVFPKAPAGYVFPGDNGVSEATVNARWYQFSPRVGFAFDVFGNGKTSLRAGAGVYYASLRTQAFNSESLNQPYAIAITLSKPSGGLSAPYKDIGGAPYPFTPPVGAAASNYTFTTPISTINDFDPNFSNSRTDQWNVSVQQQLPGSIVSTIAYVGSTGEHLFLSAEINPGVYSKGGARLYAPTFSSIQREFSGGHSTYHSLQTTLNKRLSKGISVLASYTWSRAIDNGSSDNSAIANPFSIPFNRGLSDFDIRHNFVMSGLWQLPTTQNSNFLVRAVANGWQISGIWAVQTGVPFTVLSGADNSLSGVNLDLADRVGTPSPLTRAPRPQQIAGYFNTAAFKTNAPGTFGNSGRNSLIGPGSDLVTLGVQRNLVSYERLKVKFRAEAFNAFNHPVLTNPNANVSSATFGTISTAGNPRVGQAALRLEF